MSDTATLSPTKAWMISLRLRTLPLALLTASMLQILSNLANDYGDAVKGSDDHGRIGPLRGMQLGLISREQMKFALLLAVALSLLSGALLIFVACNTAADVLGFLCLGVLSIIAAITYTVGTRPYGYMGLGDLSVLIFFGWLSVGGAITCKPALFTPW